MAISLSDEGDVWVLRVQAAPETETPVIPVKLPPLPSGQRPRIVIDSGPGAQALIVKFEFKSSAGPAISFGRLALNPATGADSSAVTAAKGILVAKVAQSLSAGGSGAEPIELEWGFTHQLSLNDFADLISAELKSPATIEIPGIATVSGSTGIATALGTL